jgi:hypothetical protein
MVFLPSRLDLSAYLCFPLSNFNNGSDLPQAKSDTVTCKTWSSFIGAHCNENILLAILFDLLELKFFRIIDDQANSYNKVTLHEKYPPLGF